MSTACSFALRFAWLLFVLSAGIGPCCDEAAATAFSGTVVNTSNQPLAGVTVVAGHDLFPLPNMNQFIADGQATTDAQGHYSITSLASGDGTGNFVLAAELN